MKPIRIQLSRKKGWRKPPNTVIVSRPSKWGNYAEIEKLGKDHFIVYIPHAIPVNVATKAEAHEVAAKFYGERLSESRIEEIRRELRGKNLACWCPLDCACHADVLLRIANSP